MSLPLAIVIEDEPQIRRFVRFNLEKNGWQVHEAEDGRRGLIEIASRKPDLIILDLGLPKLDGIELIRLVRTWSSLPIIVLSARTQEDQKILALDVGADDYITKPFGVGELMARVRANSRRPRVQISEAARPQRKVCIGTVEVDPVSRVVSKAGEVVKLTPLEYKLLLVLISNPGRVLSHKHLLHEVWGPNTGDQIGYLRVYMKYLRQKLEDDPTQPKYFLTETGVGYRLQVPVGPEDLSDKWD